MRCWLSEFLKEHYQVEELTAIVAKQQATNAAQQKQIAAQQMTNREQQKQIEALTAGLQKVSVQVDKQSCCEFGK